MLLDLARAEHGAGGSAAFEHVRAAYAAAADPETRAEAVLAFAWAGGTGEERLVEALAMFEAALAGVAGRDRELELRLEALRLLGMFMDTAAMRLSVGVAERFAGLEGRTQGECELLLHVAVHRFLGGRSAADVMEPITRAVADPALVAAMPPGAFFIPFVIGQTYKADRLELARRLAD